MQGGHSPSAKQQDHDRTGLGSVLELRWPVDADLALVAVSHGDVERLALLVFGDGSSSFSGSG